MCYILRTSLFAVTVSSTETTMYVPVRVERKRNNRTPSAFVSITVCSTILGSDGVMAGFLFSQTHDVPYFFFVSLDAEAE